VFYIITLLFRVK